MRLNNLPVIFPCLFCLILTTGCKVNQLHLGSFKTKNEVEAMDDTRNYLMKNDGTKVYGENIVWTYGLLSSHEINIDGQKFKIAEIRGFRNTNVFYHRVRKEYIKRIVRGKINVYVMFTNSSYDRTTYVRTDHYVQKGDLGELTVLVSAKEIKKIVEDCSIAADMADHSNGELRKLIKEDENYLNQVFEIYNNDCKKKK